MKPRPSDAWLLQYSGEHLLHELKMFWYLAAAIPLQKDPYLHDAAIESFVQHLRNLIWFFCKKAQFDDDVVAADYLDDPHEWKERESPTLQAARKRANKELNHLTRDRKNLGDPLKDWKIGELFQEIEGLAKKFEAKASGKKLHQDVRTLLKSSGAQTVHVLGGLSASTNTTSQNIVSSYFGASTATWKKGP